MNLQSKSTTFFLKLKEKKVYTRFYSKGEVFVVRINRTNRHLSNQPVIEKSNHNWIDELKIVRKQYVFPKDSSTKLPSFQLSGKKSFNLGDLVRTGDKNNFAEGDYTKWSWKLYENTDINDDTITKYHINELPER